ncbi:hypothetical protein JIN85_17620 [Luteolibacter pohnpeiensis]|uniref:Uncharacterized protein n=1 Tax=Luteolibacter pohnpeiensis TaxID=454153 RepID=A0A934VXV3_9BACT|nr:hypothetical protein [Luteolibacter pohnpeiensis]MBK1884243.1 hypothetical protein [Luteolibacter pohnpeiensis]
MRTPILLLLPSFALGGELKTLELTYKEGTDANYAAQVEAGFKKLLDSDSKLAAEFKKFEFAPPENTRGRYSGEPKVQVLTLAESEHVDFRDSGGSSQFGKTIALYFRFDDGMHRGSEFHSGFFALFEINGDLSYRHVKDDGFELSDSKVVATFKGFSRTLTAPAPIE